MVMDAQTLSPVEAGRLLGVGRNVAYRLVHDGTIPVLRLGKKLRVPRAALEALLRSPGREEMHGGGIDGNG